VRKRHAEGKLLARSAWLAGSLIVFSIACSSNNEQGLASVSADIGPAGGTLTAADGTSVYVPAAALTATVTLTLSPATDATAPSGLTYLSTPWTLSPTWQQFAQPITVTFPATSTADSGSANRVVISSGLDGAYALSSETGSDGHVTAQTMGFATGAPVAASCPVSCTSISATTGQRVSCSATCVGHSYALSCDGVVATSSCTCTRDGVVTAVLHADLTDEHAAARAYQSTCLYPSTSLPTVAPPSGDAGHD
jgi:hypothetical protein